MAEGDAKAPAQKGAAIGAVLAVAMGFGAGWGGTALLPAEPATDRTVEPASPRAGEVEYASLDGAAAVVPLPVITTNLREPTETWVRVDLAAVFTVDPDAGTADRVHQDVLALLRTLSIAEVSSPSAFMHLRDELRRRARHVSDGAVSDVLVRGFLIE